MCVCVGKVYLAHIKGYPSNAHLYALKVLKKEEMIERDKVHRVLTEREILTSTHHPFIVTYYCSFQDESKLYILMEYCSGGELFRLLQKQTNHCFPEHIARFYTAEVLSALEYLHQLGIVYRDLKPENILLHASGHIRLTDFDLSKETGTKNLDEASKKHHHFFNFLQRHDKKKRIQQFNSFVGTAEYIAPEVITGFGYDATVDWWTLGILLYEMLYGTTPFKGTSMNLTFKNIVNQKLSFPELSNNNPVSRECQDLIKKLLSTDPQKRLGHRHGAQDIKAHPFFRGIYWESLSQQTPPIIPNVTHALDFSHFPAEEIQSEEDEDEQQIERIYSVEDNLDKLKEGTKLFSAFEYKPRGPPTPNKNHASSIS
jgi:protein-serine/threonine kinase